jgi:voltage-gated sodium channel
MLPPRFEDIELWLRFRKYVNEQLRLKEMVRHWVFEVVISAVIVLSFINAIFFMFHYSPLVETFDSIFIWVFFVELLLRVVAFGPENFFMERWNNVDTLLVAVGLFFFFVPNSKNADGIARMSRIFRLSNLLRLVSHSNFLKGVKFEIGTKLANMYSILL